VVGAWNLGLYNFTKYKIIILKKKRFVKQQENILCVYIHIYVQLEHLNLKKNPTYVLECIIYSYKIKYDINPLNVNNIFHIHIYHLVELRIFNRYNYHIK